MEVRLGGLLDEYLCFGETAWGDQYAYKVNELKFGIERVYFIEGLTMEAEPLADSFSEFLQSEFFPNSVSPYDELTVEVRKRLGKLNSNEHIIYVPSPLLGGDESSENVQKIETTTGMIFNGDLCCQLAHESTEREINRIGQIVDDSGRQRLIVEWA